MSKFSYMEAINFGWSTFQKNIPTLVLLALINFGVSFLFSAIGDSSGIKNTPMQWVVTIFSYAVSLVISLGTAKITLDFVDKGKGDLRDLYNQFNLIPNYFIGTVLLLLAMAGVFLVPLVLTAGARFLKSGFLELLATVTLVVAGIVAVNLALRFSLFAYIIVDKKLGPIDALKLSSQVTQGARWSLFVFGLILAVLNVIGALAVLVGLLATIPTSMLAFAYVYRKFLAKLNNTSVPAKESVPTPLQPA